MAFDAVIDVQNVSKSFGGLAAVRNCSLRVERGSITGLIGPNGAGKSTLFNLVAGNIVPDSGRIVFDGRDVTGLAPYALFGRGMLRTFQIAHEFSNMTAMENLMVVADRQPGETLVSNWVAPGLVRKRDHEVKQQAADVIDFLKLAHVKNELAGNLSGGQKKLLELGRTMMVDAKVVLLDEVAAGVNRTLLQDLAANIERMNRELGYSFFVIEHDMDLIGRLCDPVIVMAQGEVIAEGPMAEIRANPAIIEAYFGSPVAVTL
ncbi:MAG: ABC transporter ATP-binding protein [Devosia nanyangense]|uniref:ABC transporter ATP-binding protein n=1 Tax=Devosia nanyangense TaxID=1228055 RepID=A0A933L624_9HYPH|nr:ABC transporter ATP-binding protein [Devosia nanyangense]